MNNRIKVFFPITDLSRDGAQRQLFELVKGMDKKKFQPYILTLRSEGSMESDFQQVPGLEILPMKKKGKYDLLCLFRIFNKMRQLKPEVVQPFLTPATFFGLLPSIWSHVPIIVVTERNASGRTDRSLGFRLYAWTEDFFSRFADWAIPNSEAGRISLIQRGISSKRIRVIFNGLNFQRLETAEEKIQPIRLKYHLLPENKVVGMMARFFPIKNHAAFFKMAALVSQALPNTRFALLGDGPLRNEMVDLSSQLGLDQKTIFFGEQKDVGAYLSLFDITVMTSDAEGCSNSILESMAMGKPVVATDVGGNREVISPGETGFLVPPGDSQAMAEKVIQLLRKPDQARLIGQKAREFAITKFSVSRMITEYESLYETTLKQKIKYPKNSGPYER